MINEGRVLAERYEITGKIGAGGMSDVYKAKDHKLNRYVAVKVLKSEFSENKNFVSKFRIEAQSAAILMHPNIVTVYDVGEEDGLHYIVMELVEGITLKKYIERKLRLSVKEAISIAIQVAKGIGEAHKNHIIHRDIKPQNIIISKDGRVKVTDFGIARAATSNTITSNAMGSVHYTSPEQARGSHSDEKSDIYSLGVTIYEMLTGRVPFDGETTVSIAIQHIQNEFPSPREYVDDIPVSVELIIFKCCQKLPARRYQSMYELEADLKQSMMTPDEEFVTFPDFESQGMTRTVTEDEIQTIRSETGTIPQFTTGELFGNSGKKVRKQARGYSGYTEPVEFSDGREMRYYPGEQEEEIYEEEPEKIEPIFYEKPQNKKNNQASKAANPKAGKKNSKKTKKKYIDEPEDELIDEIDPKMERLMSVLGIIAAIIIVGIAVFIASRMLGIFKNPFTGKADLTEISGEMGEDGPETESASKAGFTMPQVTGMNFDDAKSQLQDLGLVVTANYVASATVEKGQVLSQSINSGETVYEDDEIELEVSSGRDGVSVPDVEGLSEAEARVALENEGFEFAYDESASDTVEKGMVVSQNPAAGESVQKGSKVTVIISTGASTTAVEVPDLRNMTENAAKAALTAVNLEAGDITEEYSETVPEGSIISQSIVSGTTVNEGSKIGFVISKGVENILKYYKINYTVNAPATYAGGLATVSLAQADTGQVLFQTNTNSFPVDINLTGITGSDEAIITISYTIDNTVITENEDGTINSVTSADTKKDQVRVKLTPQEQ